jgi:hypothetical protein
MLVELDDVEIVLPEAGLAVGVLDRLGSEPST